MNAATKPNKLVLFTTAFPSGKGETYLESEIEYLAKAFESVLIVPLNDDPANRRSVPSNVDVLDIHDRVTFAKWRLLGSVIQDLRIVTQEGGGPSKFIANYKTLFNARRYAEALLSVIAERGWNLKSCVLYSYWFYQWSLIIALIKSQYPEISAVSRAHFTDVYNYVRYVPFKQYKVDVLNVVVVISEHARKELAAIANSEKKNIRIHYLGVEHVPVVSNSPGDLPLIVSCSTIRAEKRVDLIARCIAKLDKPVKWVHFGGGDPTEVAKVESIVERMPEKHEVELKGWTKNPDVLAYYGSHHVDLFMNLSTHEGVPVSIMEATSFGIPVVAMDIFGVSEAMPPQGSVLLKKEAPEEEVVRAMEQMLDVNEQQRNAIASFCRERFDASKNYPKFIEEALFKQSDAVKE